MTDELEPAGTEQPEIEELDDGSEEEEAFFDVDEPLDAVRVSPFALAAFILSLAGLYLAPRGIFIPPIYDSQELLYAAAGVILPLGTALIAFWLASRAAEEILDGDGKLGGVGFYRAAQVVSVITVIAIVLMIVLTVVLSGDRGRGAMEFGVSSSKQRTLHTLSA